MTTTTETRPDGTEVTYRYGEAFGEADSNPYLARSSKRLVNAAIASGWHAEFTRSGSGRILTVHLTPKSKATWERVEKAEPVNPNNHGRRKWLVPVRIDLMFDADTGAYLGGSSYRTWDAPLKNEGLYGVLGETVADVQTYIEFPQKWLDREAAARKNEAEAEIRARARASARSRFMADPDNEYAINKLTKMTEDPAAPNLAEARSPRDVMREASTYATALVTKRLAETALRALGWTDENDDLVTVSRAVARAASEVSRSYEKNGAEVETLNAVGSFLDEYWGRAT